MSLGWFSKRSPSTEPPREGDNAAATVPRRRPSPTRLSRLTFDRFLQDHPRVVVDVWAAWCAPCRRFAPIFEQASGDWRGVVEFGKLQVEREPSLVTRLGIRSIPSLLFFRDGRLVRTETGVVPQEKLESLLRSVFRPSVPLTEA